MDSFIFALNAVAPIILMVVVGYVLKRIGLFSTDFAKQANKLVFRVFLPVMLFLNVYNIDSMSDIGIGYIIYAVSAVLVVIFIAVVLVACFIKEKDRRAPLMQAVFRSNYALIGIPLAQSLFGAPGAAVAALLSAFTIPLFNVVAVICFAVFGSEEKPNIKKVLVGIAKNPLIWGVGIGVVFMLFKNGLASVGVTTTLADITPLYKLLSYLSSMATPLALLALGAQFEFSAVPELKREIIIGTAARCVIVPALCLGVAYLIGRYSGAHFAAFVALFATPVAVSTVPMTQEMGADTKLAGQLVVWTTLFSSVTIFLFTFILKLIGVFA